MRIVQVVYVLLFLCSVAWPLSKLLAKLGAVAPTHGAVLAFVLTWVGTGAIIIACNMPAILCLVSSNLTKLARFATSDDNLVVRKQYCQAAGAEARNDLDEAARLYREEIRNDPEDAEVHRHLAEVLLKQGQSDGALDQFHMAIAMFEEKRDRAATMFRLGEVLEDELNKPNAAREVFDKIIRECPGTPFATHARKRWES
ncbi:MAG: tetratricopeptide repeat protein [Propionibacteriaceae bacterium]|nr:tetratricopeptide repeat protein [Propionibacteriaceae bacterium]